MRNGFGVLKSSRIQSEMLQIIMAVYELLVVLHVLHVLHLGGRPPDLSLYDSMTKMMGCIANPATQRLDGSISSGSSN